MLALLLAALFAAPTQAAPQHTLHRPPKPLAPGAITSDWTRFLGPNNDATSPETHLLKDWPEQGPELVWEIRKGEGYATPAIADGRLILFHRRDGNEVVQCLHAETGEPLWQHAYPVAYRDDFGYSDGPRCPPLIDGGGVYVYGVTGVLHCLELATGNVIWRRDLKADYKVPQNFFGVGDTPLIDGERVIVNVGAPDGPCVVALDKRTGETLWETGPAWSAGYSSPIAAMVHGQRRVFVFAGAKSNPPDGGLLAINPETGKLDFQFPWRSRSYESVNAACPVVVGDRVFISASYRTGGALLQMKPDFTYDVLWRTNELGTHWTTAVHKDGYLYGFDGRHEPEAELVCLDLATGKSKWREQILLQETFDFRGQRLTESFIPGRASLLHVDGGFLCLGEWGHLLWLDLSPEGCEVRSRAWLTKARFTWGMPVLSRGLLYVNQNELSPLTRQPPRLLCYDLRGPGK